MTSRARKYVVVVIAALAATALTTVANAGDWSKVELYGAAAGLIFVVGLIGNLWIDMAPDGALRRRPRG
jgi:hypothetical protein